MQDFEAWAEREAPVASRGGEWEVNYPEWGEIHDAYLDLLRVIRPEALDAEISNRLLYLLGRDNEIQFLERELAARPPLLLALTEAALRSDDADARWQIADALGAVEAPDESVVPALEAFVADPEDYVSRRALLALARRTSSTIEPWAVRAWDTGEEYQRIAALHVLATRGSALLAFYLAEADADGREHLANFAERIRKNGPEA